MVVKLRLSAAARQLDAGVWDTGFRAQLFELLADYPPRDLEDADAAFLRSLPIFKRLLTGDTARGTAGVTGGSDDGRHQLLSLEGDPSDYLLVGAEAAEDLLGRCSAT